MFSIPFLHAEEVEIDWPKHFFVYEKALMAIKEKIPKVETNRYHLLMQYADDYLVLSSASLLPRSNAKAVLDSSIRNELLGYYISYHQQIALTVTTVELQTHLETHLKAPKETKQIVEEALKNVFEEGHNFLKAEEAKLADFIEARGMIAFNATEGILFENLILYDKMKKELLQLKIAPHLRLQVFKICQNFIDNQKKKFEKQNEILINSIRAQIVKATLIVANNNSKFNKIMLDAQKIPKNKYKDSYKILRQKYDEYMNLVLIPNCDGYVVGLHVANNLPIFETIALENLVAFNMISCYGAKLSLDLSHANPVIHSREGLYETFKLFKTKIEALISRLSDAESRLEDHLYTSEWGPRSGISGYTVITFQTTLSEMFLMIEIHNSEPDKNCHLKCGICLCTALQARIFIIFVSLAGYTLSAVTWPFSEYVEVLNSLKSRIPRSDPSNREYYVMKDMANDYLAISVSLLLPLNNGRTVVPKIVATEMVAFHVACHQQLMFLIDLLSFKDEYLLDIKINEELRRVLIGRFQNFFKDIVDHVNLKKLKLSKFIEENGSVTLDFSDSLNYESSDIFERDINGLSELTKHMILVDFNNFIEEKKEALHSTTETLIYSLYMFIAGFVTNVDQQLFVDNKIIEFFESLCSKAVGLIKHLTWAIDQFPNEKLSDRDFQSLINDYDRGDKKGT
ncbi:hypothetical protein O9G_004305 [Rozella allomycis CSF55]|uniref:Uncharacterized protein n=1 Tax=Rozella allomycis (strain CSF55) TaxID=988480 RepID=A0A075AVX0_ROZAC|nr:hypothetical protein O9G_004305 [Rozella allomycis CSF55]|eukprot:EPZ32862.1 hypothetical protein O9G_004305 [Rozella allomycis CSF55]